MNPQPVSENPGGLVGADESMDDDEVCDESHLTCRICSVHDERDEQELQEDVRMRPVKSPSAPSRQEVLEHSLTHYPFRSWCPHCIRGRAKATKHVSTGGVDESTVPVVGSDYAFMSGRSGARSEDEEEVDKDLED